MASDSKLPTTRREKAHTVFRATSFCCFLALTLALTLAFVFLALAALLPSSSLLCSFHGRSISSSAQAGAADTSTNAASMGTLIGPESKRRAAVSLSLEADSHLRFDCQGSAQDGPVVAHLVERLEHPFFISIADLGTAEKPNRNFQRILKGKLFQKPAISETIQAILGGKNQDSVQTMRNGMPEQEKERGDGSQRKLVIDVGANIGMATFAATSMGYGVMAFEPVIENVKKICDGIYLNRVSSLVKLYHLAVSDTPGHVTMHKVMGRLDNSAVSASGAKLAFKSNDVVPIAIQSVTLDSMIPPSTPVLLLKIDVQGWEHHVLRGASRLLSRPPQEAPYIIYEDDERLLRESNSTSDEILQFLADHGYRYCTKKGGDRHCTKEKP